jgi:6-phosphogluconolactonase
MKRLIPFFGLLFFSACCFAQAKKEILYVGTFSVRGSEGIYAYSFNRASQTLTLLQTVPSLESPTFLTIHPSNKYLYSVNRGKADATDQGGSVSSYGIDATTGRLSGLNHKSSYGDGPCYVEVDKTGKYVIIAHYNEGNLTVLSLFKDGMIGSVSDAKKYTGSSINTERQESPHIHAAVLSQDNRFLYITDLGSDKIYTYDFDAVNGTLHPGATPEVTVIPGAGPRHFAIHPTGKYAYLSEELTSTVGVFSVDKISGALTLLQDSVPSLPGNFTEKNSSADIHTDVTGKYLYMSNRGADVISIFTIAEDGKINLTGNQRTGGKTPRNFLVDPQGEFLFVANQDTDNITIFRINARTGQLTSVGKPVAVPSPVCLKLLTLN